MSWSTNTCPVTRTRGGSMGGMAGGVKSGVESGSGRVSRPADGTRPGRRVQTESSPPARSGAAARPVTGLGDGIAELQNQLEGLAGRQEVVLLLVLGPLGIRDQ